MAPVMTSILSEMELELTLDIIQLNLKDMGMKLKKEGSKFLLENRNKLSFL